MKTIIASASLALFLTACTAPAPQAPEDANFGRMPEHYQGLVADYLQHNLDVPKTAELRFSQPRRVVVNQNLSHAGRFQWTGYSVNVLVSQPGKTEKEPATKYVALLRNDLGTNRVLLAERADAARFLVHHADEADE